MLLQWPHIQIEEVEPVFLPADLIHVDVARRHGFVAAFETVVVVRAGRPFTVVLHHVYEGLAELLADDGKPVDVRTGLERFAVSVKGVVVLVVDISVVRNVYIQLSRLLSVSYFPEAH